MPTSTGTYDTSTITYDQSSLSYDGFPAPLSGMPAIGVFMAWTGTPYEVNPTGGWTEISGYVRQITLRRGRQDDLQQFPPGAAQLVLDNRDRYFDPFNTSAPAPFYGNLVPRKQIRIVANWNGVEYPLFRGYVAGWPVEYADGGTDSTVTIDCFDVLGLMANEIAPVDWYYGYLESLVPYVTSGAAIRYWKANDSRSTTTIRDQYANVLSMSPASSTPAFVETPPLNQNLNGPSASCIDYRGSRTVSGSSSDVMFSSLWFQAINQQSSYVDILWEFCSVNFQIRYDGTTNTLLVNLRFDGLTEGRLFTITPRQNLAIQPIHLVAYGTPGNITVFINGEEAVGVVTQPNEFASANEQVYVKGATIQEWWCTNGLIPGISSTPTGATIASSLYNFGIARIAETTTARMQRILDSTSWPSGLEDFTASPVATVGQLRTQDGVIPELHLITQSESSVLFGSKTNLLTFLDRDYYATQTRCNTSQVTFTDTGIGVEYDAQRVRLDYDADRVRNDVNVKFSGGGIVSYDDTTSIASYGAAEQTVDTLLDSPTSADTLAQRLVTIYKNPKMTLEPFMSKGQQDPTFNWPRLLGLELLDRVTFKRTPATGSAIVKDLLVQSIEHRITPGEWQTVVNGSARYTNWFIVGVSLIGGDDLLLN